MMTVCDESDNKKLSDISRVENKVCVAIGHSDLDTNSQMAFSTCCWTKLGWNIWFWARYSGWTCARLL